MKAQVPNHIRRVIEKLNDGKIEIKPGTVQEIDVRHETACDLIQGRGECTCSPEIGDIRPMDGREKK